MSQSIPPPRRNNLQDGAYRMVFTDKKKKNEQHTKLNLRDRSCDANNLFGDANALRVGSRHMRMQRQDE